MDAGSWHQNPRNQVIGFSCIVFIIFMLKGYAGEKEYFFYAGGTIIVALIAYCVLAYGESFEILPHGKYSLEYGKIYKTISARRREYGGYFVHIREVATKKRYRLYTKERPPYYFQIVGYENEIYMMPYLRVINGTKQ